MIAAVELATPKYIDKVNKLLRIRIIIFCYQVSVGLKYKLKENLHVILDLNSFNSTPSKERTFLTNPPTTIGQPAMDRKNVKYKIGELNTLLGIGFDF